MNVFTKVMTGEEMAECQVPDRLTMLSYLSQVYEAFRGEIPHIKHPKLVSIIFLFACEGVKVLKVSADSSKIKDEEINSYNLCAEIV